MKFGQLIVRKITKIVACTRCQILRLKCTKIDFGWGSAPDSAEGAYSAPTGKKRTDFYGKGRGRGGQGGEGSGGEMSGESGREGRRRKEREPPCVSLNFP